MEIFSSYLFQVCMYTHSVDVSTQNAVIISNYSDEINSLLQKAGNKKRIIIIHLNEVEFDYQQLFSESLIYYSTRLGILNAANPNNISFVTNFHLNNHNMCPNMFYELYTNYCSEQYDRYIVKLNDPGICEANVIPIVEAEPFVIDTDKERNPGYMVSLLRVINERRNVNINYKDNAIYQDEFMNNGFFNLVTKDLFEGKFDMVIGHLFMNYSEIAPIHYGPLMYADIFEMAFRNNDPLSNFKKLFVVYEPDIWFSLSFVVFLVFVLYYCINRFLESKKSDLFKTAMEIFGLSIGGAMTYEPRSLALKLLLSFYLIFAIIIDSSYLGKLSGIFVHPPMDKAANIWYLGERWHFNFFVERISNIVFLTSFSPLASLKDGGNTLTNRSMGSLMRQVS